MSGAAAQKARAVEQESALRLFNRVVNVTVARQPKQNTFVGSNPTYFDSVGNGIEITGLRVQLSVKKSLGKEPNVATVTITNCSKSTRSEIQQSKPLYAFLAAGHDGVARHLFAGNVTYGRSLRKGTDWETKLQIADGGRAFAHSRMSHSYRKPVYALQVLQDAAAAMGLKLPPEVEQSPEMRQALASGFSAHGPTRDVLTRLLAPYGFGWSIQNGVLQVLADDQVVPGTAILIDQQAGLIGTPELTVPNKPGAPSDLKFQTLIYPEIQPGGMVEMDSLSISGIFKVQDVEHKGDTAGQSWYTEVTATPIGQAPKHKGRSRR